MCAAIVPIGAATAAREVPGGLGANEWGGIVFNKRGMGVTAWESGMNSRDGRRLQQRSGGLLVLWVVCWGMVGGGAPRVES